LERKLKAEKDIDQEFLDKCVREWLIVYRTEVGDEKVLSFHGIDHFWQLYQDEDRSLAARTHLESLTGRAPKL
jgi:hypothetical protein